MLNLKKRNQRSETFTNGIALIVLTAVAIGIVVCLLLSIVVCLLLSRTLA